MKKLTIASSFLFYPTNILFVFLLALTACDDFSFSEIHEGTVVKVLDGDSINIVQQGKEIRFRLAEVDAPEHGQAF